MGSGASRVLVGFLVVVAVATVVGLVWLWPGHAPHVTSGSLAFSAPGVTFPHARVVTVQPACRERADGEASVSNRTCGHIRARVLAGVGSGKVVSVLVQPEVSRSGLSAGDTVELIRTPPSRGAAVTYLFFTVDRATPLWILMGLFVVVVAAVARLRGVLAIVGLGFAGLVLVKFMLPGLLSGESGLGVALVGSSTIMFVVLFLAHGVSIRTSTALAGTLGGILLTALIGVFAVHATRLTGVTDESASLLSSFIGDFHFQGLLNCAIIVAGLGVLNDVTITQASSVWELRSANPGLDRTGLFTSAMRIGRDHIASTIYTIIFAYTGTALSVLLLLFIYDRPLLEMLSSEDISEEIVRTLASAIGLVLAVPLTTLVAVIMAAPRRKGPNADTSGSSARRHRAS